MENLYDLIVESSRGLRRLQRKLRAALKAHRKAGGGPASPELAKVARAEVAKTKEGEARAENSKESQEAALKAQAKAEAKAPQKPERYEQPGAEDYPGRKKLRGHRRGSF
jgi:hypothetical protein